MLATAGVLLAFALAPQEEEGNVALRQEAAFARALTFELGFDDLAEVVLDEALTEASGKDRSVLLFARCDVRKLAAQRATDSSELLAALGSAGEAYAEFLATDPPEDLADQARISMGEVAFQYGSALKIHFDATDPPAEEKQALRIQAEEVFKPALAGMNLVIADWEGMDDGEEKDSTKFTVYFPGLFYRALIFYYWGLIYPPGSFERTENTRQALERLESFALLVGDASRAGFLAYKHMADTYVLRGELEDAEAFYEHVIESGVPEDADSMTAAEVDGRQAVVQAAYLGYLRMLLDNNRLDDARRLGDTFLVWVDNEGVILNQDGYRVQLQSARAKVLEGAYSEAIELAQRVARENPRSQLLLEASEVMSQAIAAAPPGFPIELKVLYDAAYGSFFNKKDAQAIGGFLQIIPRLGTTGQADEFGPGSYYYLGRAYQRSGDSLLAAAAFQAGYERFPDDEDTSGRLAKAWMTLAEQFRNGVPGDPVLDTFYNDAVNAVTASSGEGAPDAALWRKCLSDYNAAKDAGREGRGKGAGTPEGKAALAALDRALESFGAILPESRYYEQALVHLGMCEYRKMDWDPSAGARAFRHFDDYLETYVPNPEHNPADARGRKVRSDMSSQAAFYRGQVRYKQGRAGDDSAWEELIRLYADYRELYPEQADYGAATMANRCEAFLRVGKLQEATAEYEAMLGAGVSDSRIAQAAGFLSSEHYNRFEAQQADGNEQVAKSHLEASANYLREANTRTSRPRWQNLQREARMRLDLGEFQTAEQLFRSILDQFAEDRTFDETSRFFVRVGLVDSLLAQDKAAQAQPVIDELLEERPTNLTVIQQAVKVKVGWPVIRDGVIVEVPGVGTAEAFDEAEVLVLTLNQLAEAEATRNDVSKWEYPDFWHARFQQAYLLYQRSRVDTSYRGSHADLIDSLERLAPELGGDVAGPEIKRLFEWLKAQ